MQLMTVAWLASIKRRALRKNVWYKDLMPLERSVVELTIRYVDQIKSPRLILVISRIVCKLLKACQNRFLTRVEAVGYGLADKMCRIAVAWGSVEASRWRHDVGFIRYLGVTALNTPSGWG